MSYNIIMMDDTIYTVSDEEGEAVKEARSDKRNRNQVVDVDDDQIVISSIRSIKKIHDGSQAFDEYAYAHSLNQDNREAAKLRCRGKRSIQLQITMMIRKKYAQNWKEYMRDSDYREKVRLWIHEKQGDDWCDFKAGTCVCTSTYNPDWEKEGKTFTGITSMFPGAEVIDFES